MLRCTLDALVITVEKGRNKMVRKTYHRKLRKKQKRQIKKLGDIKDVVISIGYTD